jgi:glutamyl-tRNA reductase
VVTNRTTERAEAIARQFGGGAVTFEALYDVLPSVDIVLCSTGAPEFVIKAADTRRSLKSRRKGPLMFIDISVPRNIDPEVAAIDNAFVFDVDDLESVVQSNLKEREREAQAAEAIIETEVIHFLGHLRTLDIGPAVVEVKELLTEIARGELRRTRKRLGNLTEEQETAVREILLPALVNKLAHPIILHLRHSARDGERAAVLDELRKLIKID